MEITYRFLDTNSESEILQWLDLCSVCFHQKVTRGFWDFIHMGNPYYIKTKPLVFIAQAEGHIVGSISLIPSPVTEYREGINLLYKSLLLCKAMVHPDYREKGIFGNLLKNAIDNAKSEKYDLVLTISNNIYSYRSFLKIGFHDTASMGWSRLLLSGDNVVTAKINTLFLPQMVKKIIIMLFSYGYSRLIPHRRLSYQIKFGDIPEFFDEIENFYTSSVREQGIYGSRTASFLRWRFFHGNTIFKCFTIWEEKKMLGYAILQLIRARKTAYIVDINCSTSQKPLTMELIAECINWLKANNYQTVWIYLVENNLRLSKFFSLRNGFFIHSPNIGELKKSRLLVYVLNDSGAQQSWLDSNNWNIQAVDTCLFLE